MKAVLLFVLLTLAACGGEHGQLELVGSTMGTQFSVKFPQGLGDHDALRLQKQIKAALADSESQMSTFQPDSVISLFNSSTSTEWYEVIDAFCSKVQQSLELSELTNGAFDITVGPLVKLWGFGPGDIISEPPPEAAIATLLNAIGYGQLQADCAKPAIRKSIPQLELDMSAIGKGYAADRIALLLDELGFDSYLIEVGGELRLRGHNSSGEKWAIGIEAPLPELRRPHKIIHLTDTAMATSGDYRNFFEADGRRYSHTIDTRTGRPVTHALASVTVVARRAYRADALATALLVMGPDEGMSFAVREGIAALLLLRTETGLEERPTPAFEQLGAS